LLEPSSTNLVTYSEDFSQSSYTKVNSTTIEVNQIKAPDNTTTADLMKAAQTGSIQGIYNNISFTSGQSYVFSVFAKKEKNIYLQVQAGGGTFGTSFANFDLQNGVIGTVSGGTGKIEAFSNDWYRCIFIVSAISTGTGNISLDLISSSTAGRNDNFTGNVGDGLYIWGAMVEQQSYATSYIPTTGSTVTRAAETCNSAGNSSVFNDSEGVLYWECSSLFDDSTLRIISVSDGSQNNTVQLYFDSSSNRIRGAVREGSGTYQCILDFNTSDTTNFFKVALKYKQNDFALWVNGIQIATDTNGNAPTGLNTLNFDSGSGSNDFFGKIKNVQVYNTALTDAELIELTS
jgi:hypothetical protein